MAAALLRLAFHDAGSRRGGLGGPNGSVRFELDRAENVGPSLRAALRIVEVAVRRCGVGWADAIAVSGASAVEAAGGPRIEVGLGRRDAAGPDPEGALPAGGFSADDTRAYFRERGFSDEEAVALCGAHTLGRWTSFIGVSEGCMARQGEEFWRCSREEGKRLPFSRSPESFDTGYFQAIAEAYERKQAAAPRSRWKDRAESSLPQLYLLPSDNSLMTDDAFREVALRFAGSRDAFFAAFSRAYVKLVS